jgi:hypothetical protein
VLRSRDQLREGVSSPHLGDDGDHGIKPRRLF